MRTYTVVVQVEVETVAGQAPSHQLMAYHVRERLLRLLEERFEHRNNSSVAKVKGLTTLASGSREGWIR